MSKTWQTKKRILRLISKEAKTPGEISDELDLAPSTVSEHLDELEKMGAVNEVENEFVKKWKYYKANPAFDIRSIAGLKRVTNIPQIVASLAIILGIVAFLAFGLPGLSAIGAGNPVVFSLTDPPSVPAGTQSLNITYSSLQAHYVGTGNSSAWVTGYGSGNLDLMTLINASQIIGTGSVPANSTIDQVKFAISSASIVINGTAYNVTVPSGELVVPVTGANKVTSNSSVLIDLSPVVTTIYTNSSTVFVLVPSVKAVLVGNATIGQLGERHVLTHKEGAELNATTPVVSIISSGFSVAGNATHISVSVKNNGNKSIVLRHVILYGTPDVVVSAGSNNLISAEIDALPSAQADSVDDTGAVMPGYMAANGGIGTSVGGYATAGMMPDITNADNHTNDSAQPGVSAVIDGVHVGILGNGTVNATTHMPMLSEAETAKLNSLVKVGANVKMFRVLNFFVTENSTLELPFVSANCTCAGKMCPTAEQASIACIIDNNNMGGGSGFGYVLQPGATANLTFSGQIVYAEGHIQITPIVGSVWKLVVAGEDGAQTGTNVTVTSG